MAGVLIGLPTLRLRGDYLAIVTLGFGEIVHQAACNGDADGISSLIDHKTNFNLTSGAFGINPIDPPGFGSWLAAHVGLPANFIEEQGTFVNFVDLIYWSAIVLASDHDLLLASAFATRGSAGPGSPSARTRWPLRRWGSR